jgi:hypothetical protein
MLASSQSKISVWDIRGDVEESKQITMIRKHTCGGAKFGES